jgi:hypothetical protein
MNRIQGSNRWAREREAGTLQDFWPDAQQRPMRGGAGEVRSPICGIGFIKLTHRNGSMKGPVTLDERQVRRDDLRICRKQLANGSGGFLVEKPRKHCTRLGIQAHPDPRSSSRS